MTQTDVCCTLFHMHVTVWAVTHRTPWLGSTGACDIGNDPAAEHSAPKRV